MATLKDRLSILIKKEGLNPNQFYLKTRLANGFLDKVGNKLNRSTIEKIQNAFPQWNIDYLVYGEGEMLKSDPYGVSVRGNNNSVGYGNSVTINGDYKNEIIKLKNKIDELNKIIKMQENIISDKERLINLLLPPPK